MLILFVILVGVWILLRELFHKTSLLEINTSILVMAFFALFYPLDIFSVYIQYVLLLLVSTSIFIAYRNGKIHLFSIIGYSLFLLWAIATNYFSFFPQRSVNIVSPFKEGDFYVAQGGNNFLLNGHRFSQATAQSYALDITKLSSLGRRALPLFDTKSPADYFIYNEPVFSPCNGVVKFASNQFDDLPVGERDRKNVAGNYVVIACESKYTLVLAHLQRSVSVAAGDVISIGQRLGLVGNSGNTTEPHLHIHAVSGHPTKLEDIFFHGEGIKLTINGRTLIKNSILSVK
jgi:hypothetical protein